MSIVVYCGIVHQSDLHYLVRSTGYCSASRYILLVSPTARALSDPTTCLVASCDTLLSHEQCNQFRGIFRYQKLSQPAIETYHNIDAGSSCPIREHAI